MTSPRYPSLYQVNTRVWLTDLARRLGRGATLDDIPDSELDSFAELGFDWIWLLSVWQTGPASRAVSLNNSQWRHEFQDTLPDLSDDDIGGSGFAIAGYTVHAQLGGDAALARLRHRLQQRGLKLLLDFVPNHMALDHPWIETHPEYFVAGTELDLARAPQNFTWVKRRAGDLLLAHGRDPYFPGWPDTLQLNYGNPDTQAAMIGELTRIAGQCDGVRCDMAMLVLPDVFQNTWGAAAPLFWPSAIDTVRSQFPEFTFMAECYWDLEWTLQQQGFDYTYDKRLYDRLLERHARPVREHFWADMGYQNKLVRFLENHDEPRAAATFPLEVHRAAAIITFLAPGMRFFHQGQLQGRTKRISPHLVRGPAEPVNAALERFYQQLLELLRRDALRDGDWRLLECSAAWDGNWTSDGFIAFGWQRQSERWLVAVNFAPHQSQCNVRLPAEWLTDNSWQLREFFSGTEYTRPSADLREHGLFLDQGAWQPCVFSVVDGKSA